MSSTCAQVQPNCAIVQVLVGGPSAPRSRRLVDFALRYGRIEGNKHVLDRNESRRLIEALNEQLRLAKRVMDKGGIAVVTGGDTLVTTYNVGTHARPQRTAQNEYASAVP
jgi:hypothetical protein